MNPWKVSAQFAAFLWFTTRQTGTKADAAEAARFAKENWPAFLPCADKGIGMLLIRIVRPREIRTKRFRACYRARKNKVQQRRTVTTG